MDIFRKIKQKAEKARDLISSKISGTIKSVSSSNEQPKIDVKELNDAISSSDSIIAVAVLDKIAKNTFDIEKYESTMRALIIALEKELNPIRIVKLLIVSDYLIKNGCSGCIDDFRDHRYIFKYYSKYTEKKNSESGTIIRKKAQHMCRLLEDKQMLQKEKILINQIKMKLLDNTTDIYGENNYTSSETFEQQQQQQQESSTILKLKNLKQIFKINDLVENYFYKYLDNMNDKLDDVTNGFSLKLDSYIGHIQRKLLTSDSEQPGQFVDQCMAFEFEDGQKPQQPTLELESGMLEFEDNPDIEVIELGEKREIMERMNEEINIDNVKDDLDLIDLNEPDQFEDNSYQLNLAD